MTKQALHHIGLKDMYQYPFFILHEDPLKGYTPSEALQWLSSVTDAKIIADSYAVVSNHLGTLMHELDNDDPYTKKLASMNKVPLNDRELDSSKGPIINLQSYLRAQKRILETAA